MNTLEKQTDNLERGRDLILSLGYDYIRTRSKMKKSIVILKRIIQNSAYHYKKPKVCEFECAAYKSVKHRIIIPLTNSGYNSKNEITQTDI